MEDRFGDQVKMMTVHAAKGLEFPVVFMVSMNEGIFPSRKTKTAAGMEEERRPAFVAATRAEDLLFLSRQTDETLILPQDILPASSLIWDLKI